MMDRCFKPINVHLPQRNAPSPRWFSYEYAKIAHQVTFVIDFGYLYFGRSNRSSPFDGVDDVQGQFLFDSRRLAVFFDCLVRVLMTDAPDILLNIIASIIIIRCSVIHDTPFVLFSSNACRNIYSRLYTIIIREGCFPIQDHFCYIGCLIAIGVQRRKVQHNPMSSRNGRSTHIGGGLPSIFDPIVSRSILIQYSWWSKVASCR